MLNKNNFLTEEDLALAVLNKVRCNFYGDFAVVVEGHKGLKTFSLEKIIFKADKNKNLNITGKNLYIRQLTSGYALVAGEIEGVVYEKNF